MLVKVEQSYIFENTPAAAAGSLSLLSIEPGGDKHRPLPPFLHHRPIKHKILQFPIPHFQAGMTDEKYPRRP